MKDFFLGSGSGHSLMVLVLVIGIGLLLGKIKFGRLSFGPLWILLAGIAVSAAGMHTDPLFLHFIKEFGLVLFVFSVGMQVGPGLFSSFRGKGWKLNLLSMVMIGLTLLCVCLIWVFTTEDLPQMVGLMAGAGTNAPAMGTAQQTWYDVNSGSFLAEVADPQVASEIGSAFTVAYPVGILCLLLVLVVLRRLLRSRGDVSADAGSEHEIGTLTVRVINPSIFGQTLAAVEALFPNEYVVTSFKRERSELPLTDAPVLEKGDILVIDTARGHFHHVEMIFGEVVTTPSAGPALSGSLVKRKILVTKPSLTGTRLAHLDLPGSCHVTVTKVARSGVGLIPRGDLLLQMGDTLSVIGTEDDIRAAAQCVGNSSTDLEKPNLIPIFIGLGLGLIVGAIPLGIPGAKGATIGLGLAGGCLIVAILLGHFGPRLHITTYTTSSALRMMRELGLCLMLGAIGLGCGRDFGALLCANWLSWIGWAALLTVVPALVTGLVAAFGFRLSFTEICGLLIGSSTNADVLGATPKSFGEGRVAENYATVYPVSMFLRVLVAAVLILVAQG